MGFFEFGKDEDFTQQNRCRDLGKRVDCENLKGPVNLLQW